MSFNNLKSTPALCWNNQLICGPARKAYVRLCRTCWGCIWPSQAGDRNGRFWKIIPKISSFQVSERW